MGEQTVPSTRAKFQCHSVTKTLWGKDQFVFGAKFHVVYGDSVENKAFFAATPSGEITIMTVREDQFVPGQEYYVDFTPAAEKPCRGPGSE